MAMTSHLAPQQRTTTTIERPVIPAPRTEQAPAPASPASEPRPSRLPGADVVDRAVELNARFAPTALRLALAAVFVWFGALKLAGVSPVEQLLAETLPFLDPDISVPVLGAVEVVLGLALAIGKLPRIILLVLVGHLAGTFLTFVTASELMWGDGFLQLTADGEFVVKNVVFITAALMLIGWYSRRGDHRAAA
jgi:putative oxidoreductase